tara:strand:+ start:13661 stop:16126 length:2466 start_codon:yes stop_codon:yes gene_type:complete
MKKAILLFCFGLLLISFTNYDQNLFAELVEEKLLDYTLNHAPEKIYIHTDKSYYSLDESIWYSAYLVNGITHSQSDKSNVLYVEIINSKDSILDTKKLLVSSLSASGDFKIGKNWKAGNYMLRAYTNYMRNDVSENFFRKKIQIVSPEVAGLNEDSAGFNKTSDNNFNIVKPNLKLYPEGGYLVENIRSKIAIKIEDKIYHDTILSGKVIDNDNKIVTEFESGKFGLSIINFKPEPNKNYHAILDFKGIEFKYPIPDALPIGHTLSINNSGNFIIISTKSTALTGINQCYLVVHQRGKMVYNKLFEDNKDEFVVKLPVEELNDGIVHITLFDSSGNPVCERLVFVSNPKNKVNIDVFKDKTALSKKEKLSITINIKDNLGNSLPSNLSMSIRDISYMPYNKNAENIKSYLLLNSELDDMIINAGYFFVDEFTPQKRYLLDLVMMTNGWRRFTWQELLYEKRKIKFDIEKGLFISGKTQLLNKPYSPAATVTRLSFLRDNIIQKPVQKTDKYGRFEYGPFVYFDSVQILLESRLTDFKSTEEKDRDIMILIDRDIGSPEVSKNISKKYEDHSMAQLENLRKMSAYLQKIKEEYDPKVQRLEEITITAEKEDAVSKRQKEMDDRTNYAFPSNRIDVEADFNSNAFTVFDLLLGVPGVSVSGNSIFIRGSNGEPNIVYDGFPIDVDFLGTIDASQISFIDVLKDANAAFFSNSANGVIAIYSRIGSSASGGKEKRKPGIIDFTSEGFYTAREFNSSNNIYSIEDQMKANNRTTLYWKPNIEITEEGFKDISFYTSNLSGEYLIEIEGISKNGLPIYHASSFTVE